MQAHSMMNGSAVVLIPVVVRDVNNIVDKESRKRFPEDGAV